MPAFIKLYIEHFFGRRSPVLSFYLNGLIINPKKIDDVEKKYYQTNSVFYFEEACLQKNILQIIMSDKTDHDLLFLGDDCVDHYVKVREFEINDIKAEQALANCSKFTHSMDDAWIERMSHKGINISKVYGKSTELRLNGVMEVVFSMPFWQWQVENGYE